MDDIFYTDLLAQVAAAIAEDDKRQEEQWTAEGYCWTIEEAFK